MCRELIISLVLISCGLYVVSLLQAMSYQTHYGNVYITIDVQCNLLLMTGNLLLSMSIGLANMFLFVFFYNVWLPIEFCIKSVLVCILSTDIICYRWRDLSQPKWMFMHAVCIIMYMQTSTCTAVMYYDNIKTSTGTQIDLFTLGCCTDQCSCIA